MLELGWNNIIMSQYMRPFLLSESGADAARAVLEAALAAKCMATPE